MWEKFSERDEGEELALKGFLAQDPAGGWHLSQEAKLKSCCVGSLEKKSRRLPSAAIFLLIPHTAQCLYGGHYTKKQTAPTL